MIIITDVKTFITNPDGINLVVVKVETNQPGLYGLGCATFTQRCRAVLTAIDEYIKPLVIGKDASEIQELWNLMYNNAYWRNGPVVNNAVAGVDMALWDIKGKLANMPVYDLVGGKCREAVSLYSYANGNSRAEILDNAQAQLEKGFHHIRLQYFPMQGYPENQRPWSPIGAKPGFYQDSRAYTNEVVEMFGEARDRFGYEPEFIHDVHERVPPCDAIWLAKELEPFRLYFLEDLFAPNQYEYYRNVKNLCSTPIAHGELCTNPAEWERLISERLIDFIRIHFSMVGGFTQAVKIAHFSEIFGIRTAWHGPTDMNPVGHAAQMQLGLASSNFGIQEWSGFGGAMYEVFDGIPEIKDGYAYLNDRPGFGIDFSEEQAKKYPHHAETVQWTQFRHTDGGLYTP